MKKFVVMFMAMAMAVTVGVTAANANCDINSGYGQTASTGSGDACMWPGTCYVVECSSNPNTCSGGVGGPCPDGACGVMACYWYEPNMSSWCACN